MESNPNNTVQEPVVLSMDEERHKKEASSAMVLGIVGDVLVVPHSRHRGAGALHHRAHQGKP